jgi:hypothetical protein
VICADVIEHLGDPDALIGYLTRRVSGGGRILISTPERNRLRGSNCRICPNPAHVREWSFAELASYLQSRGLQVHEHFLQYPVRLGLNRVLFNEVIKRLLRGRPLKYNQVCLAEVA